MQKRIAPGLPSRALLVACCLSLAGGCSSDPAFEGPARHVVIISLDTTRADHLGLYGNDTVRTPHLDRLASESIVFDDLMTVVPTTLASHASLFTGKYPHSHGTPRNGFVINADNVMLPELLRDRGFATAGFAASFALAARFGIDQGFDLYDENFERFPGQDDVQQNERSAEAVTDAVIEHLDGADARRNLFLFVHYFDPHSPYAAPPPFDTMYDPRGREGLIDWATAWQECSSRAGTRTEADRRMSAQYAGEISYMDTHVGRLLDELRRRGILDEALLLVTSDHGENLWEHAACYDHGWTTYQTTMRAVGIVRLPGAKHAGARVGGPVASIDLLPSVLDYLGIPAPEGIDGRVVALDDPGADLGARVRFGQATKPWKEVETDPRWTNALKARCVRDGRYKLVRTPYEQTEELYDLVADPSEQTDLLADPTAEIEAVASDLRGKLEVWAASADPLPTRFEISQQEETIRRLKALGYLQ